MTPYQTLVDSLAVSGITDEATILRITAERNVAVDAKAKPVKAVETKSEE